MFKFLFKLGVHQLKAGMHLFLKSDVVQEVSMYAYVCAHVLICACLCMCVLPEALNMMWHDDWLNKFYSF